MTPTKPKVEKKKPPLSYGSLTLIETRSGDLRIEIDIGQAERTSEQLMDRLRATLCGLQYVLNKNESEIHSLGEAYLEGLENGVASSRPKPSSQTGPKIGFHAELKDEQ